MPHEFVDVTLASGLTAALGILVFFGLSVFWVNLPVMIGIQLIPDKHPFWKRIAITQLALVIATIILFLGFGFSWSLLMLVVFVILFLESFIFLFPIVTERFIKRTGKPIATQIEESFQQPEPPDGYEIIRQFVGTKRFVLFVICPLLLLGIGYLAGYHNARSQVTFHGLEETDFVCVGRYGTHFVFRRYDPKEQLFKNEFMALGSSDMSSRRLKKTLIKDPQFENQ